MAGEDSWTTLFTTFNACYAQVGANPPAIEQVERGNCREA